MARAHNMDAVRTEKFYFRKHVAPPTINDDSSTCSAKSETIDNSEGDSQPLDEAFNTNGTRVSLNGIDRVIVIHVSFSLIVLCDANGRNVRRNDNERDI
jgi:hypothetical protein